MYYFYVLFSQKDKHLYYGYTSDLKRRLAEHTEGIVKATTNRRPLVLAYYESYQTADLARKREHDVKLSGAIRKELKVRLGLTE